jgi:hypothetical protein
VRQFVTRRISYFPAIPPERANINMNTLTEEEMAMVTASGDPVAGWPTPAITPPGISPLLLRVLAEILSPVQHHLSD